MAKLIVQFSGGKDSMASLLWVRNNISKNFITIFCDTGFESKITYDYINKVADKLSLDLRIIRSKKYKDFVDLAVKKKRFPSSQARFCTHCLKSVPMIDFVLDDINEHVLIIQGIRKDESHNRSLMSKDCTFFKYYFEPYKSNRLIVSSLIKRRKLTISEQRKLQKAKERLRLGKNDEKYHTYRKKDVIEFRKNFADDLLRPIFNWSARDVINYILENDFDPNPLYKFGMKRVGCFPCIMSNHTDIRNMMKFFPERINQLSVLEKELNTSLFPPNKIPKWACTNKQYPTIDDIVNYINNKNLTGSLFEDEESTSCLSFYGLCE